MRSLVTDQHSRREPSADTERGVLTDEEASALSILSAWASRPSQSVKETQS